MSFWTFMTAWFVAMILFGVILAGPILSFVFPEKHYWNGKGIDMPLGAPDGIYEVLPSDYDNVTVTFPVCSHSYGYLHGTWDYNNASGLVWFPSVSPWLTPCIVKLSNNTIVEAWKK